jgi:protein phosphatase
MDRGAISAVFSVLRRCGSPEDCALPHVTDLLEIISACRSILASESSLLELNGAFVIVGDIHGNVADLVRIFERLGYPPATKYVLLGDFIDRGPNSVEVIILLFALKVLFPMDLFLVRGNHECDSICSTFGFMDECIGKLGWPVYAEFIDCFGYMPFGAVIDKSVLCVHGGISPEVESLSDIAGLVRPMVSSASIVSNGIVWSDPRKDAQGFEPSPRGTGSIFNAEVLDVFLKRNGLSLLVRGHEWCMDGFEWPLGNGGKCVTVFSASDYCGIGNVAAVMKIGNDGGIEFVRFEPLREEELSRRIVLIPEWALSAGFDPMAGVYPSSGEFDADPNMLDLVMYDSIDTLTWFYHSGHDE